MAHPLEGTWRSFIFKDGTADPPLTSDGTFNLKTIDPNTGKITDGEHDIGGGKVIPIEGQVTTVGNSFAIVMEHPEEGAPTKFRRYEGLLTVDTVARQVIIGKKGIRDMAPPKRLKGAKKEPFQDDGTVVITRP